MARPKSFDPDAALDDALEAFWSRGYEATSVQDLVDATGLSRSSLYGTFGDKQALYLAALDRYRQRGGEAMRACLAGAPSPLQGLKRYFDLLVEEARAEARGCFMTNAAVERAALDPDTAHRARTAWEGLEGAFAQAVRRAQEAGEVPEDRDARRLGRFLTTAVFGIRALTRAGADPDLARDAADEALGALQGPGA